VDESYLIWSNEKQAWWRPGGHTIEIKKAGRYSRDDAIRLSIAASSIKDGIPEEMPIRAADMQAWLKDI